MFLRRYGDPTQVPGAFIHRPTLDKNLKYSSDPEYDLKSAQVVEITTGATFRKKTPHAGNISQLWLSSPNGDVLRCAYYKHVLRPESVNPVVVYDIVDARRGDCTSEPEGRVTDAEVSRLASFIYAYERRAGKSVNFDLLVVDTRTARENDAWGLFSPEGPVR